MAALDFVRAHWILPFGLALISSPLATGQEVGAPCGDGQVPICYGEHASCAISKVGQLDVYIFLGAYRDKVLLTLAGKTKGFDPQIEVLDPTGQTIASKKCVVDQYSYCSFELSFDCPMDGLYTLLVNEVGNNQTGNYDLDLQRFPPPYKFAPPIDYGQTHAISLGTWGDRDWRTFAGEAGTKVRIIAAGKTKGLDPRFKVYDPDFAKIGGKSCTVDQYSYCSVDETITIPQSGVFHILVDEVGWNQTGTIDLTLQCIFGICPPPDPPGSLGTNYCSTNPNSSGVPAVMEALGSPVVADNDVHLQLSGAPAGQFGMFFFGSGSTNISLPAPSQGTLCLTGLVRLPLSLTCNDGTMHRDLDLEELPQGTVFFPGQTWYFQGWFRDLNPDSTSNTTDGLMISFM